MGKSNSDSSGGWKDAGHWGKVSVRESQSDYYVGKNDRSGDHCHMYKERDSGKSGVVHRGSCKVCDDKKSGGK